MQRLCKCFFRGRGKASSESKSKQQKKQDAESSSSVGQKSRPESIGDLSTEQTTVDSIKTEKQSPPRRESDRPRKKKSRRKELNPYIPSCVSIALRNQPDPKCFCGCDCGHSADGGPERSWHPEKLKLSKCAGIVPSLLAGAYVSDTESEEEEEAREIGHRRAKQWHEFQLANGTETEGYRLSPR